MASNDFREKSPNKIVDITGNTNEVSALYSPMTPRICIVENMQANKILKS